MSCGVGHRHGSDLVWLLLWHRRTAWELLYATECSPKKQKNKKTKKQKQKKKTKNKCRPSGPTSDLFKQNLHFNKIPGNLWAHKSLKSTVLNVNEKTGT